MQQRSERDRNLAYGVALLDQYSQGITAAVAEALGPSLTGNHDVWVLMQLRQHGPLVIHDVAAAAGLPRTSVARAIDRLADAGVVQRSACAADRRKVVVGFTEEGHRLVERMEQRVDAYFLEQEPLVKEVGEVLDRPVRVPNGRRTSSAFELIGAIAATGTAIEGAGAALHRFASHRERRAVILLLVWGAARPGRLAAELSLSTNGTTALLDRLEADGLIVREHDPAAGDRRAVRVALTEKGVDTAWRVVDAFGPHAAALLDALVPTLARRV